MRWLVALLLTVSPAFADDELDMEILARNCLGDQEPLTCIGIAASVCMETKQDGQSTAGMVNCTISERDGWDLLLNEEYQQALEFAREMDSADEPHYAVRVAQLTAAQRAWIAFRDTNCAVDYGKWGSGSIGRVAGANCHLQMTAERTLYLRNYQDELP